jgi:DNA-binding transcriptional MerR regulator
VAIRAREIAYYGAQLVANEPKLPDKLFFKIGEVAQIVGVRPHVLRYWETEFNALRPMKTRGSHRVYRRKDVELAVLVRRLLHDEGLTMAGAKRRLRDLNRERATEGEAPPPAHEATRQVNLSADLLAVRRELAELIKAIDRTMAPPQRASSPAGQSAITVTSAVQSTVPISTRR